MIVNVSGGCADMPQAQSTALPSASVASMVHAGGVRSDARAQAARFALGLPAVSVKEPTSISVSTTFERERC